MGIHILTPYEFPEHNTEFGNISFDFIDSRNVFIISFCPDDPTNMNHFQEGSVYIQSSEMEYDLHKEKILTNIMMSLTEGHKSGVELESSIIAQLRLDFAYVTVDPFLENMAEA